MFFTNQTTMWYDMHRRKILFSFLFFFILFYFSFVHSRLRAQTKPNMYIKWNAFIKCLPISTMNVIVKQFIIFLFYYYFVLFIFSLYFASQKPHSVETMTTAATKTTRIALENCIALCDVHIHNITSTNALNWQTNAFNRSSRILIFYF